MANPHFIREFLKHPMRMGTVTQSSVSLARKMAEQINGSAEVIEFGPGTGPVTVEILKRLPQHGRLICFEINPEFCRHLAKIPDPRLKIINDDANNCRQYVRNIECVVSGLPLALFSKAKRDRILDITSTAKRYIQLQYTPFLSAKIQTYFPQVKVKFVPKNFPPAFIYICTSPT